MSYFFNVPDFFWFFGIYLLSSSLILFLLNFGTLVHEAGHALFAKCNGADIDEIVIGGKRNTPVVIFGTKFSVNILGTKPSYVRENFKVRPSNKIIRCYALSGPISSAIVSVFFLCDWHYLVCPETLLVGGSVRCRNLLRRQRD